MLRLFISTRSRSPADSYATRRSARIAVTNAQFYILLENVWKTVCMGSVHITESGLMSALPGDSDM